MSKILVIDDEEQLVMLLKDTLEENGHEVLTAFDGIEGIEKARMAPDIIILDVMMPNMDGFELCKKIRDEIACPIIFLSAKASETDRIQGLNIGGDDYIVKPFGLNELMAKIEAHLRREKRAQYINAKNKREELFFGKAFIDLRQRTFRVGDCYIEFTKREFDLIEFLALHPGQIFSREQIYERIWGYDAEGDYLTVNEHVKKIRAKLSKVDKDTEYISTVWGIGYKWNRRGVL
ncbi:response regulator transcription factor [Clostridium oryzae]|uniref:Stage 0 sporulation protein A homolog n=1 Tax=Clostridium oryzae TaxID=1450648 RepID=A0A1V4IHM4_9CLOT|nr:response regulator transcription factor [Clostridium oryzae]OPJ59175.1 transcriptional regulatory protein YycF [Clostridium oryzae]